MSPYALDKIRLTFGRHQLAKVKIHLLKLVSYVWTEVKPVYLASFAFAAVDQSICALSLILPDLEVERRLLAARLCSGVAPKPLPYCFKLQTAVTIDRAHLRPPCRSNSPVPEIA